MKTRIVILARDCDSTHILYNYMTRYFDIEAVVFEEPISRKKQFFKRAKRLGTLNALSQVAFMLLVLPFIKIFSQKRKKEIFQQYRFDEKKIPGEKVLHVDSLNKSESRKLLQKLAPDLLIVNGTKIISQKTLETVPAPFINIHVGITPLFRGVHGGYWAMAAGRKDLFGTTIHYVDPGVDTGNIIEQVFAQPDSKDNFYTYPYLQLAICLPVLKNVVDMFVAGQRPESRKPVVNESSLWFHPTIFQWIGNLKRTC